MAEYIFDPLVTDVDQLTEDAFAYLQDRWPEWTPEEGNLEAWLVAACARMVAEARDVASDVPIAIFQYFGQVVLGVDPIAATPSVVSSTWTLTDNPAGRTIEGGTLVTIEGQDGDSLIFQVVDDVIVAATVMTTAAGAVLLRSVEVGSETANAGGAGETAEPLDRPSWMGTVTLTGVTSGGADAEEPDAYLNRLAGYTTLLTPRPILPSDFELLSKDIALRNGVQIRALALDNTILGRNQKDKIDFSGTISGGTFTLTVNGQVTSSIAWNASLATIQTALEALSNVNPGDVILTDGPAPNDVTVEFTGQYYRTARTFTATSSLTGGGTVTITSVQTSTADQTAVERAVSLGVMQIDGTDVSSSLQNTIRNELDALRELNFIVSLQSPERTAVDVTLVGVALAGYDSTTVQTNVQGAITDFLNPANAGKPPGAEDDQWISMTTIRHQDLSTVANNVNGFSHWTTLTTGLNGGAQSTTDKTLIGLLAVTKPGTISVTIA